jgi:hypothetical protein
MPTTVWIQETESTSFEAPVLHLPPALPPRFDCPHCGQPFEKDDVRADHVAIQHPTERPSLEILGHALPSLADMRVRFAPLDVTLRNCRSVTASFDGDAAKPMSPRLFAAELASRVQGVVHATLRNPQAEAEYGIRFLIPSAEEIRTVEELFLAHLAIDDVDMTAVRRFSDATASQERASQYAGALVDYIVGILAKDQDGGTELGPAEANDRFHRALDVLKDFRRPIARFISAFVRFNLNDFLHFQGSGNPDLDAGFRYFAQLAWLHPAGEVRASSRPTSGVWKCPIDTLTSLLLRSCTCDPPSKSDQAQLTKLNDHGGVSEPDRAKTRVILANEALRAAEPARARHYLQRLSNDEVFGVWAVNRLREISAE